MSVEQHIAYDKVAVHLKYPENIAVLSRSPRNEKKSCDADLTTL